MSNKKNGISLKLKFVKILAFHPNFFINKVLVSLIKKLKMKMFIAYHIIT